MPLLGVGEGHLGLGGSLSEMVTLSRDLALLLDIAMAALLLLAPFRLEADVANRAMSSSIDIGRAEEIWFWDFLLEGSNC